MLRRDNQEKNRINEQRVAEQRAKSSGSLNEEDLLQSDEVKEMYNKIITLKKNLDSLKSTDEGNSPQSGAKPGVMSQPGASAQQAVPQKQATTSQQVQAVSTRKDILQHQATHAQSNEADKTILLDDRKEIRDAEQAIIEQARKDVIEARRKQEAAKMKRIKRLQMEQEALEAQKRAQLVGQEAIKKRQEADEAKKKAIEAERNKALEEMDRAFDQKRRSDEDNSANTEELKAFFGEEDDTPDDNSVRLAAAMEAFASAKEEQGKILEKVSQKTADDTGQLAAYQLEKTRKAQALYRQQQAELEKARKLELAQKKREELVLAQKKKEALAQRKREEKLQRAEDKERLRQKKKEANDAARQKKMSEADRRKKASEAAAELGGGVVNINGVTINTEVKEIPRVRWRDFFGLADRRERKAKTKAEQRTLKREREKRREEARELADKLSKRMLTRFKNSAVGQKIHGVQLFCEQHKAGVIVTFSVILTIIVGTAGIFNYYTAYEYSYNGKTLGIVKEKDEVLQITDLVQGALTEDKNVAVVIDAKDDISFKRVSVMGDVKIDTTEEVLKRLTYMGDLNVKAYGIYVDGKKVGAVESKEAAAKVMQKIKDKYTSKQEGAKIEEAVFIEDVEVKQSNTGLQDISTQNEMVDILCTSGEKETIHKVVAGETLADIAKLYSMTDEELLNDNKSVDPKKLEVGSNIVIRQNAPILTVKITEMVTYDKEIQFEVQKKNSNDIYEGYTETEQKGQNGHSEVTSRIVYVNGEKIQETALVTTVTKEPVPEVTLVGVKDRPPTVGSGKYIWPLAGGYTLTSTFGSRWGRMHEGIDLGTPQGNDVRAADGGTVTKAGYSGGYGYVVVIDHQNGMETYYAHNSKLLVSVGDKVFQGQHIAESGNSGRSTGPHVHFEVRVNGEARNPLNYLP